MIAERKDMKALVDSKHAQARSQILPLARVVAGAMPVMDKLARSSEWERFASILQGQSNQFASRKEVAQQKLGDPMVDDAQAKKLRMDIFIADATIAAFQFAIQLPAAILEGGEQANNFIVEFEKKNEDTSGKPQP
jgi:hypothetical protein